MQRLGSLDLEGEPVILDGKEIRALQFADDVALLATSEEDLDCLQSGEFTEMTHTSKPKKRRLKQWLFLARTMICCEFVAQDCKLAAAATANGH